jgi:hypothetical protein
MAHQMGELPPQKESSKWQNVKRRFCGKRIMLRIRGCKQDCICFNSSISETTSSFYVWALDYISFKIRSPQV